MAQQPCWQNPEGLNTINTILRSRKPIPNWTNGLHAIQLELISVILDWKDLLCCTATGDGKLAAFSIPTLVLLEYNKHPDAYVAGLPTQRRPIGVVVTPTKGLADNIVRLSSSGACASPRLIFSLHNKTQQVIGVYQDLRSLGSIQ